MADAAAAGAAGGFGSGLRFLVSGGVNTLASWGIYALLLRVLPYRWSYTIAFCCGIALAYGLYRFYVFRRKGRSYGPVWVALIYLLQYLLGIALVNVWVEILREPALWAPIFSVLISLPLTYALSRWVFPQRPVNAASRESESDD
jgi:putative flippase GtrA